MHEFKFLSKNNTTSYNGQMSREAIEFLNGYLDHGGFEITTTIATYKMKDYTYGSEGNIVAGTIDAYPLDASNIRITFKIRDGEITQHLINIDYWNTMGQLANAIRRED